MRIAGEGLARGDLMVILKVIYVWGVRLVLKTFLWYVVVCTMWGRDSRERSAGGARRRRTRAENGGWCIVLRRFPSVMLHRWCVRGARRERRTNARASSCTRGRVVRFDSFGASAFASLFRIRGGRLGGGFGGGFKIGANLVQIATLWARGIVEEGGLTAARFRLVARLRADARRFTSL